MPKEFVYAGSYTTENTDGIYLMQLDVDSGRLELIDSYGDVPNPSYLVVTDTNLYAACEIKKGSMIAAFKRDKASGIIKFMNRIETDGVFMCHLNLWPTGGFITAANYGDGKYGKGSLVTFSLLEDGSLGREVFKFDTDGVGKLKDTRQECSHIHSTGFVLGNKYLYAADLGLDKVYLFRDEGDGRLSKEPEDASISLPSGEGPRHLAVRGDGQYLYIVAELGNNIFLYQYDRECGRYEMKQKLPTISESFLGENTAAEVKISPDDRFLYVSNRGENTIASFEINRDTGELEQKGRCSCGGNFPRHFYISENGGFVLVANQLSGDISVLLRDKENGMIGEKVAEYRIPGVSFVRAVV